MTTPPATNPYKRRRFPAEIISHCVWLYFPFYLSYRDVEALMSAPAYRQKMCQQFQVWREVTGMAPAA
jgi:transposase-like protein